MKKKHMDSSAMKDFDQLQCTSVSCCEVTCVVTKFNLVASQTCVSPQHAESEMFIRGGLSGNFQKLFKYVGRLILL